MLGNRPLCNIIGSSAPNNCGEVTLTGLARKRTGLPSFREIDAIFTMRESTDGILNSYAETCRAGSLVCQVTCSTGPTTKTKHVAPVNATPAKMTKAQ
jgi:hypothetical protein